MDVVRAMEAQGSASGNPKARIKIAECGTVEI